MTQSNGPKAPERKPMPDKEAIEARRIILARRAQYVALAMMAAGAATNACGGDVEGNQNTGGTGSTLTGGSSNTTGMQACLNIAPGGTSARDTTPCLSIAVGGRSSGVTQTSTSGLAAGGSGAVSATTVAPCLKIAAGGSSGGMTPCLDIALPTGGQGTTTAINTGAMGPCLSIAATGATGAGAMGPCLSPPQA